MTSDERKNKIKFYIKDNCLVGVFTMTISSKIDDEEPLKQEYLKNKMDFIYERFELYYNQEFKDDLIELRRHLLNKDDIERINTLIYDKY